MKRLIGLLTVLLLHSLVSAEPLMGYFGISFGSEREIVKKELEKQGWISFYSEDESTDSYVGFSEDLTIEGCPIQKLDVSFDYNNVFFDIRFYFAPAFSISDFENLLMKLEKKYGLKYLDKIDGGLYYETDNGNIIMVTTGTQRNLLSNETEQIFVLEMFDRKLQRNNYNYNYK